MQQQTTTLIFLNTWKYVSRSNSLKFSYKKSNEFSTTFPVQHWNLLYDTFNAMQHTLQTCLWRIILTTIIKKITFVAQDARSNSIFTSNHLEQSPFIALCDNLKIYRTCCQSLNHADQQKHFKTSFDDQQFLAIACCKFWTWKKSGL